MAAAMTIRSLIAVCCALTLSGSLRAQPGSEARSAEDSAKDWALLRCLGHGASSAKMRRDYFASAGAIFQRSQIAVERFNELDALAQQFVGRKYGGTLNVRYNGLKCVNFYHSRELQSMVEARAGEQ
jgi:Type VI secretion system (T6SS), amidase immunity protein